MAKKLHFHFSLSCIGEGNGNPLQCFCLENPRDGGAWSAAVYGVAQSQTLLKRGSGSSSNWFGSQGWYYLEQVIGGQFIQASKIISAAICHVLHLIHIIYNQYSEYLYAPASLFSSFTFIINY